MSEGDWISSLKVRSQRLGLSSTLICQGGKAPETLPENRAFHHALLEDLTAAAKAEGWPGAAFDFYRRREGWVSIQIVPAEGGELTLAGLHAFRDDQKRAVSIAPPEPRQAALF